MTDDRVTFLRARLDEDERAARSALTRAPSSVWIVEPTGWIPALAGYVDEESIAHVLRHDPARVLRDVEATRRIIELHDTDHECSTIRTWTDSDGIEQVDINRCTWVVDEPCSTLRLLALPYANHPAYRDEWKP